MIASEEIAIARAPRRRGVAAAAGMRLDFVRGAPSGPALAEAKHLRSLGAPRPRYVIALPVGVVFEQLLSAVIA